MLPEAVWSKLRKSVARAVLGRIPAVKTEIQMLCIHPGHDPMCRAVQTILTRCATEVWHRANNYPMAEDHLTAKELATLSFAIQDEGSTQGLEGLVGALQ